MISIYDVEKKFSSEIAFLILICRSFFKTERPDEISKYLAKKPIKWEHLYFLISEHEIRPLVFNVLKNYPDEVPPSFYSKLRADCWDITITNSIHLRETCRLIDIFKSDQRKVLPYKGVFQSLRAFEDMSLRECRDIDLIISKSDHSSISQSLITDGYITDCLFEHSIEMFFCDMESQRSFRKETSAGDILVEIQWRLTHERMNVPEYIDIDNIKLTQFHIGEKSIDVLDDTETMYSTIIHHGLNDSWRILKSIADVSGLILRCKHINYQLLFKKLEDTKTAKCGAIGFQVADELFGVKTNQHINGNKHYHVVVTNLLKFPPLKASNLTFRHLIQHLKLRDSTLIKIGFVLKNIKFLASPRRKDQLKYNFPRKRMTLLWFVKPIRLIIEIFQGHDINITTK